MRNKDICLQDVADLAGVSIATASRVINKKGNVSPSAHKKVWEAIQQLGYEYDTQEETETGGEGPVLIFMSMDSVPDSDDFIRGVTMASRSFDCLAITTFCEPDRDFSDSDYLLARSTGAVGAIYYGNANTEFLKRMNKVIPTVMCHEMYWNEKFPSVTTDHTAVTAAANHLISGGCRRLALINLAERSDGLAAMTEAFQQAVNSTEGCTGTAYFLHASDLRLTSMNITSILLGSIVPDGFVCVTDSLAAQVVKEAKAAGLSVPEDVSVISLEDSPITQLYSPPISAVSQSKYRMGYSALEMVISNVRNHTPLESRSVGEYDIIIRDTTRR
jgi:DNA-binding LacI/PurR family transcriptional regulator